MIGDFSIEKILSYEEKILTLPIKYLEMSNKFIYLPTYLLIYSTIYLFILQLMECIKLQ